MNKPRNKPLTYKLTVRMDTATYFKLYSTAHRANKPLVECVRDMINKGAVNVREVKSVELPGLHELTIELSRIGRNLNQIAWKLNSGVPMNADLRASLVECLRRLYEMKYKVDALGGEYNGHPQAHRREEQ